MAKVLLDYDKSTDTVSAPDGSHIGVAKGLELHKETSTVEELIKLKNAGFTAAEVIEIGKAGLL